MAAASRSHCRRSSSSPTRKASQRSQSGAARVPRPSTPGWRMQSHGPPRSRPEGRYRPKESSSANASGTKVGEPTDSGDPLNICRTCKSIKCPVKDLALWTKTSVDRSHADGPAAPPICRICMQDANRSGTKMAWLRRGHNMMRRQNDDTFVRVINLPENTCKLDLFNLVSPFGVIAHVDDPQLDENTGSCSKLGIVEFVRRKDAELAISLLNGYFYGSRILRAEWITPGPKEVNVAPLICAVCTGAVEASVRVNNLPGETCEHDLFNLCHPFGVVNKLFLTLEKTETGLERKFGIVEFVERKGAKIAISLLDGYTCGKLYLRVDWATPADLVFAATNQ